MQSPDSIPWRCFHCDAVFTSRVMAARHFGIDDFSLPACLIKAGAEGSLVKAIRDLERENEQLRHDLHSESTEAAKLYHAQQARHYDQLQAVEELGYERGLADGRKERDDPQGAAA